MPSDREYHRLLAESLMKSVGFEDAIDYALRNEWQGVLAELLSLPKSLRPENQAAKSP